ncbi:MAG: V-type ATP synthase subunit D [Thermoanaerobaculia bacterium]
MTKIVNALHKVILPRLTEQIRLTVDSIAEEERDEAVRRKMRLASA